MVKKETEKKTQPQSELSCFIIMPFKKMIFHDDKGNNIEYDEKYLSTLYEDFIQRSLNEYPKRKINAKRSSSSTGNFMKEIVNVLHQSDLVIADITGMNPNVMYELGIRHTLKDNTILIAQDTNQIPSDLLSYIAVIYEVPETQHGYSKYYNAFKGKIHKAIDERLLKWDESDNPVRDFLKIKQIFINQERLNTIQGNFYASLCFFAHIHDIIINCKEAKKYWSQKEEYPIPYINYDWMPLIIQMLQSEKDIEVGRYFLKLRDELTIISNNLKYFRNELQDGKDVKSIALDLTSVSNESKPIWNIDLKSENEQFVNGLINIMKKWIIEANTINGKEYNEEELDLSLRNMFN